MQRSPRNVYGCDSGIMVFAEKQIIGQFVVEIVRLRWAALFFGQSSTTCLRPVQSSCSRLNVFVIPPPVLCQTVCLQGKIKSLASPCLAASVFVRVHNPYPLYSGKRYFRRSLVAVAAAVVAGSAL